MKMNNESGRSMVEMLGVLAIIGVLSIGGIAGYTIAMNRYRANEIIDTAAKLAVIGMTKNINGGTATATFNDLNITSNVGGCVNAMTADNAGVVTIGTNSCSPGVQNAILSIAAARAETTANGTTTKHWNKLYMGQ